MHRWLALLALVPAASIAAVVAVNEPWVQPAAAGRSTRVFMELAVSENATLVDVRTPIATGIAMMQGGRRRAAPFALPLAARQPMLMRARATHIVLGRVERALELGDVVRVTLVLRHPDGTMQDVEVEAEVRRRSPSDDHLRRH